MANILIDGYNLIGIAHKDLEKVRKDLIQKLYEYTQIKGHNITLVFDGWKNGQLKETITKLGGLTIIYSKLGEKADSVIKKILSSSTKQWIVVSSDREISDFAERKDFAAVSADEFEGKLFFAGKYNKTEEASAYDKDEDMDLMPSRQKGNPRKLSRREKKKIEALRVI
jgi:predicted RNA-binding protein with PIN domain